MKERFKVIIKDRIAGEKTTFYSHSAGFTYDMKLVMDHIEVVKIVLDHPRMKRNKNGKRS
jgi:hypothetical protein